MRDRAAERDFQCARARHQRPIKVSLERRSSLFRIECTVSALDEHSPGQSNFGRLDTTANVMAHSRLEIIDQLVHHTMFARFRLLMLENHETKRKFVTGVSYGQTESCWGRQLARTEGNEKLKE